MRWDRLRDLLALQDRLNGLLGPEPSWTPAVDLFETADQYVVVVELPGFAREDVAIEAQADRLTLRGARRPPAGESFRFLRLERGHGAFARSFTFVNDIDLDRIAADFRDGVLTVTVPKREPVGPRRVPIE
jgi:HSP20 family protein